MKNILVALLFFTTSTFAIWKELAEFLGVGSKNLLLTEIDYNAQLRNYAVSGNVALIKELLKNPKVVPTSSALTAAAICGKTEALKILLKDGRASPLHPIFDTLDWAVYYRQVGSVRVLLQDPRVNLNAQDSQAFLSAVRFKNTKIVDMFLSDPRFNVVADDNIIIRRMASTTNDLDLFKRILKMPNVDPSAHYNDALMGALEIGNTEMVKILLQNQRVLNGPNLNNALQLATKLEKLDLIQVLLQCDKVDPMSLNRQELALIFSKTSPELLKPFLESPRVNPAYIMDISGAYVREPFYISSLFQWAVEISDARLVKFFLTIKTLEPSSHANSALKTAIKNEREDIVQLLLADDRLDPSLNNNEILESTKQLASIEEKKITDAYKKVKVNSDQLLALKVAVRRKFDYIQQLLYSHEKVRSVLGRASNSQ